MFKRITLAALASAAILSSAALSPASAGHPAMGGMHRPGGFFWPSAPPAAAAWATPEASTQVASMARIGLMARSHAVHSRIARTGIGTGVMGYTVRSLVDQGYVAPAYATSAPVATCPSNCLAKQYLHDGRVLFTDQCTNESATAPAGPHG